MAFTATITAVTRSDLQIDVEVRFDDTVSGFSQPRVFSFAEDATRPIVEAEITRQGTRLKQAIAARNGLLSRVGTSLTI